MAKTDNLTDFLANTANAIRTAEGSTDAINPQDFEAKITALKLSVQTADATATAADILLGKTAYVNGEKITGTFSGSGYHLEGEWTFNNNLRYSTGTVSETINFSLMAAGMLGDSFTSMQWDNGVLTYTNATGGSYTVYSAYNDEWSYPVTGDSKNINFGTTPQQVSEEFYNWIRTVAEPIEPIVIPEGVTLVYNGSEPLGAISSDGTQITRLDSGSIRVAYNTPIIFYDGMGNGLLSPSFSSSSVQTESMYWGNVYYVSDSHDGSSITISY